MSRNNNSATLSLSQSLCKVKRHMVYADRQKHREHTKVLISSSGPGPPGHLCLSWLRYSLPTTRVLIIERSMCTCTRSMRLIRRHTRSQAGRLCLSLVTESVLFVFLPFRLRLLVLSVFSARHTNPFQHGSHRAVHCDNDVAGKPFLAYGSYKRMAVVNGLMVLTTSSHEGVEHETTTNSKLQQYWNGNIPRCRNAKLHRSAQLLNYKKLQLANC